MDVSNLVGNFVVSLATMTKSFGLPALHGGDCLEDSLETVYYHREYKGFCHSDDANWYGFGSFYVNVKAN